MVYTTKLFFPLFTNANQQSTLQQNLYNLTKISVTMEGCVELSNILVDCRFFKEEIKSNRKATSLNSLAGLSEYMENFEF